MKFNLTEEEHQSMIIKESLLENLQAEDLKLVEGQPSQTLGRVLNKLAERFSSQVVLNALDMILLDEGVEKDLTTDQKAKLKAAIDSGSKPSAVSAEAQLMAANNDPSKAQALKQAGLFDQTSNK